MKKTEAKPKTLMACPYCGCTHFFAFKRAPEAIIQVFSDDTIEEEPVDNGGEDSPYYQCAECCNEFEGDDSGFGQLVKAKPEEDTDIDEVKTDDRTKEKGK